MSTSSLAALKLTTARKPRALPDVVKRRNKLLSKLKEQRELALECPRSKSKTQFGNSLPPG